MSSLKSNYNLKITIHTEICKLTITSKGGGGGEPYSKSKIPVVAGQFYRPLSFSPMLKELQMKNSMIITVVLQSVFIILKRHILPFSQQKGKVWHSDFTLMMGFVWCQSPRPRQLLSSIIFLCLRRWQTIEFQRQY